MKKFTVLHRLLHWTTALAMMVLFLTGFLRMYWMNRHVIVSFIQEKTEVLTKDEMVTIAKSIRQPMWEWHVVFAYILMALFVVRLLYMLLKGIRFPNPFQRKWSWKERLQGAVYFYFYWYVLTASITGVCIQYRWFMVIRKELVSFHKLGLYLFPLFILLHFIGIYIGERSSKKGVVSKMIGGDD